MPTPAPMPRGLSCPMRTTHCHHQVRVTAVTHPLFGVLLPASDFRRLDGVLHLVVALPDGSPGTIRAEATDVLGARPEGAAGTVLDVDGLLSLRRLVLQLQPDRGSRPRRVGSGRVEGCWSKCVTLCLRAPTGWPAAAWSVSAAAPWSSPRSRACSATRRSAASNGSAPLRAVRPPIGAGVAGWLRTCLGSGRPAAAVGWTGRIALWDRDIGRDASRFTASFVAPTIPDGEPTCVP